MIVDSVVACLRYIAGAVLLLIKSLWRFLYKHLCNFIGVIGHQLDKHLLLMALCFVKMFIRILLNFHSLYFSYNSILTALWSWFRVFLCLGGLAGGFWGFCLFGKWFGITSSYVIVFTSHFFIHVSTNLFQFYIYCTFINDEWVI